jgi:sugar fermentation stimulation protein A
MATCWKPGVPVQLSRSDGPHRKLAWTLERVDMGAGWIGVHTGRTNAVMAEGIADGRVPPLAGYRQLGREVSFAPGGPARGRLDIELREGPARDALVEVKNVTLLDGDCVRFPDAVSLRGRKHLDLLLAAVREGRRGVILFAVNRPEGRRFAPAWAIDPGYGERLAEAAAGGVEILTVRIHHTPEGMDIGELLPVDLKARE